MIKVTVSTVDNNQVLLQLAARAVGMDWKHCSEDDGYYPNTWNPLLSDADAFKLAASLLIDIKFYRNSSEGTSVHATSYSPVRGPMRVIEHEHNSKDLRQAVRKAVVRAAADIGRSKPE